MLWRIAASIVLILEHVLKGQIRDVIQERKSSRLLFCSLSECSIVMVMITTIITVIIVMIGNCSILQLQPSMLYNSNDTWQQLFPITLDTSTIFICN